MNISIFDVEDYIRYNVSIFYSNTRPSYEKFETKL